MSNIVIFDDDLINYIDKEKFYNFTKDTKQIITFNDADIILKGDSEINQHIFLFASIKLFFISSKFFNFVENLLKIDKTGNFNIVLVYEQNENCDVVKDWFDKIKTNYKLNFEIINQIEKVAYIKKIDIILESIFNNNLLIKEKELANKKFNGQNEDRNSITIYTDGACSCNPGAGGWGAVLMYGTEKKEISGFDPETTNNKMELTAVIEALSRLKFKCNVELYSDSAYVVNAIKLGWLENWKNNNWLGSDKKPVKNIELWQRLDELLSIHNVNFNKVKGHSDNEFNNRCDELATTEISKHINY